jgi:hypothetical protein
MKTCHQQPKRDSLPAHGAVSGSSYARSKERHDSRQDDCGQERWRHEDPEQKMA